jgi:hypothetical protein
MATGTREKRVRKVETVIILELSTDEAEALRAILFRVGGQPLSSRRRHADSIRDGLIMAGLKKDPSTRDMTGYIEFKEGDCNGNS